MVYFVFVLYSRLTAVIFLLFFWYYYWQWIHFLTQTGCGLFVAIPYAHHISVPEEASHSLCLWVKRGEHSPSSPTCPCHRQVSSLPSAGLRWAVGIPQCPWRQAGPPAADTGTSSTATSWGQGTCDSYRPDIPLTAIAGGKGCCPGRAHPAGAAQSQGSWQGVFALSHTRLCHPSLCSHFSHYFQTPGLAWVPRTSLERWGQPKEQLGLAPARATAEAAAPWPAPSWQGAAPQVSISSDLALNSMQIQPDCSLTWAGRNAHDKGVH